MFLKILGWTIIIVSAFIIIGAIGTFKDKDTSKKGNIAAIIFFLLIGSLVGYPLSQTGSGDKQATASKDKAEKTSVAPKNEKKTAPEKKTPEQTLASKIKKAAYPGYGKVTKVELNDYQGMPNNGKMVLVYIRADAITKRVADMYSAKALEQLFKYDEVKEVCIFWRCELADTSGKKSVDTVEKVDMTRKTADKITWKNFDYTNLEKVADTYYLSPSM